MKPFLDVDEIGGEPIDLDQLPVPQFRANERFASPSPPLPTVCHARNRQRRQLSHPAKHPPPRAVCCFTLVKSIRGKFKNDGHWKGTQLKS